MANRNTYVPTHTMVRARRIKKVLKAILPAHPESDAEADEMEADLKLLYGLFPNYDIEFVDLLGDNHSFELSHNISEFEALEVKYIKAPELAAKML